MSGSRTAVITGGGGFVIANVARLWLERDPEAEAIVVDATPLDAAARRHYAPFAGRLEFVAGDVSKPETWAMLPKEAAYVVHGAAVTPMRYIDKEGRARNPEREEPMKVIEANILGTARALDWARGLPSLARFVYVSTGSVYADHVAAQESDPFPLPEDGHIGPIALYDVTKYGGELLTQRFAELYDMPAYTVRLASVFGPMDRATPFRNVRNAANHVAHAAAAGRPVRASAPEAVGDYIYAPDVADAVLRLLQTPKERLKHCVYNLAYGEAVDVSGLVATAAKVAPGLRLETVPEAEADIKISAKRKTGRWGAYDISRAAADLGWKPRPLAAAFADYIDWIRTHEK
ncbi:MAG TPA: NAD-dependent epimerase/dehydratase family protein [Dongiaceae bacterium]|jgi:nucleoside-diphosphate-sugar epimerase|nr:NAD-dependent epimerase/dehydratase family protein [Dongiaceae bacterium]